jgi:hypothetical protein
MADKPINPFEAARRRAGVQAVLEVRDVLGFRPDWSEQQAADFLRRYAGAIAGAMLEAGTNAIRQLVEE